MFVCLHIIYYEIVIVTVCFNALRQPKLLTLSLYGIDSLLKID